MSILDRIIGKKEERNKKTEKKPETVKVEKKVEKQVSKKAKIGKTEKPKKEIVKRKIVKKDENIAHKILLENMISEKSTLLASQNKYVFKVVRNAGKFQIKEAVEGYYGVQVIGVNTIRIPAKKRIHGRTIGWKKGYKKAIVTLQEGDIIAAAEGV